MRKRLISLAVSLMMVITCMAVPTVSVYATEDTGDLTVASKTYTGSWPKLPNAIDKKARELAWPYGTAYATSSYKNGNPTDEYKEALDIAYPDRSKWGEGPKVGASCDVFVGTVVVTSGYDSEMPRGLGTEKSGQYVHLAGDSKWEEVDYNGDQSKLEPGDIIIMKYKKSGGHVVIYVEIGGKGYVAQASLGKTVNGVKKGFYGKISNYKTYSSSNYKELKVYRATGTCEGYFSKGDNSDQVKRLQNFLNWAGFNCGEADGAFGSDTESAVKKFQKAAGLEVDGKFGRTSLTAAKSYVPGSTVKRAYSGKWPTGTVSTTKGTKTNIIRWQKFLKWYGYSITTGGEFGTKTLKYTKKFQKNHSLTADGVVGSKTIKKAKKVKK